MNEIEDPRILLPSLPRAFSHVFFFSLITLAVCAVLSHKPVISYWLSHSVPLMLIAAAICYFLVPQRIEWSESGMVIQTRFRGRRSFDWDRLYTYGPVKGGFELKFIDSALYLIYPSAFEPTQWRDFEEFLFTNHAEKKGRQ